MRYLAAVGAAAFFLLSSACSGANAPAPRPLHIGVDLPLTGTEQRASVPALNGIRFFLQRHPNLDGFAVSLVTADDAHGGAPSPQRGAGNVQSFIADPNLVAMIGPFDAAVARKEIPVANAVGLAMVSPATSSPCLTRDIYLPIPLNPARTAIKCKDVGLPGASELRPTHLNNYFRLTTTDELQGAAAADYAFGLLHVLRAAVVTDHEVYGQVLADAFTGRLQNDGGAVVGQLDLDPKAKPDVPKFLQAMKAAGAQAIYFGGVVANQGCAVRAQMRAIFAAGEATPFLGGDGIADDPACVRDADGNALGIYASVPIVDAGNLAAATQTVAAFKTAFSGPTDYGPYTMLAYDATAVLYAAIDRAIKAAGGNLPVRGNVVSQLTITSGFVGVTGTIGFDAAGDTTNRQVSILEPSSTDPASAWKLVDQVDYSKALPY